MTVSLLVRETKNGKRRYGKINKKKLYDRGTVFCLRYAEGGRRRWETLDAPSLSDALAARARKEAALLTEAPKAASAPGHARLDDAVSKYLDDASATKAHRTWLAYGLYLGEFRKSCAKEYVDQVGREDLVALEVAQKRGGHDDRTVANRVAGVVTFLRAQGVVGVTLRHRYVEKKVRAYSAAELRQLMAASTDEERLLWRFLHLRDDGLFPACLVSAGRVA
jgi:hypothetical protein